MPVLQNNSGGLVSSVEARVIELTENEPGLKTWIRTASGIEQVTHFPKDYVK